MNAKNKKVSSLTGDIGTLLRERWALASVLLAFLLLLAVVAGWYLTRGGAVGTADGCVVRLLVETKEGGAQWLTTRPRNGEPGAVEFEETTIVHRFEFTGCR